MADFNADFLFSEALFQPLVGGPRDEIPADNLFDVAASSVLYDMFGVDQQCSPGTAPTVWRVTGAPDPTGIQAPAFPCGGPWEHIWIGRVITP